MATKPKCDLSVIIVNYNTSDFLVRCLESIASQPDVFPEIIVVDNASQDDSVEMVRNSFPWVTLIANENNLGFAKANNQALEICKGQYVYFLNPDTEVRQGSFVAMVEFMDSHPSMGLAGTRIVNPDGSLQSSVETRYPGERHAKQDLRGLKGDIAWVLGASMIGRRSIVQALGGFDEDFFLYGEDQDLCLRLRKAGWTIGYIANAVVVHWEGQSERNNLPADVWKKKIRAEIAFYRKHYSKKAIRAIRRENLIQALWRLMTLRITLPLSKDRKSALNKLGKYEVVLEGFHNTNADEQ